MMSEKFEQRKDPRDDIILRFTLDGLYYSLRQNLLTPEQLEASLKQWLPDAEIVILPKEATYDDGA